MKNLLLSISLFSFIMVSCDPCDDCSTITFEPTVQLIFINSDSLQAIDSTLVAIESIDSALSANIDSLLVLRDSLNSIIDSIANGGLLSQQQSIIESQISERRTDSTIFGTRYEEVFPLISVLTQTKSTINSGLMLVSNIDIPEIGSSLTYMDSSTFWNIPLSFNKDFTLYDITIDNEVYRIEFDYNNFTEVDQQRNVLVRAKDIRVINHSFDSLKACDDNCIDGEATFTFYF